MLSDGEVYSPLIPVDPNRTYEVSYWVKTDLINETAQAYGRVVVAQYSAQAKEGDQIGDYRIDSGVANGENVGGTTDWVKKNYTLTTTADTYFVRLRAMTGLFGTAQGVVWFDGVETESE